MYATPTKVLFQQRAHRVRDAYDTVKGARSAASLKLGIRGLTPARISTLFKGYTYGARAVDQLDALEQWFRDNHPDKATLLDEQPVAQG